MKNKLNIVLIYPGYPPEDSLGGGVSIYAQEAARALSRLGHQVTVVSRTESLTTRHEKDGDIKIIRIPAENKISKNINFLRFRYLGVVSFSYRIKKIIFNLEKENGKFDIIEIGDWGAESISFLRKYRDKLVIRCHTPSFISEKYNPSNKPYLSKFIKYLEKYILKNAKYLATPSKSLIEEIQKHTMLKGKIIIEPYPLEISGIPYKKQYKKKFTQKDPLKIVCVGRLEDRKGQDVICKALNILKEKKMPVTVSFIGSDTPVDKDRTVVAKLKEILSPEARVGVNFLGQISRKNIFKKYTRFDIFVIASRFESLGFVILEAMRAGLPVIGSNICEIPRLTQQGKAGSLFVTEDFDDLAENIINFVKNPDLIKKIGNYNRKKIITTYHKKDPIGKMITTYKKIQKGII